MCELDKQRIGEKGIGEKGYTSVLRQLQASSLSILDGHCEATAAVLECCVDHVLWQNSVDDCRDTSALWTLQYGYLRSCIMRPTLDITLLDQALIS
jgi:hypothetical protein